MTKPKRLESKPYDTVSRQYRARGSSQPLYRFAYPGDGPKKCNICNRSQVFNHPKLGSVMIPFVLDHINGDWTDNRLDNLQHICPICNSLLETTCRTNQAGPMIPRSVRFRNEIKLLIKEGYSLGHISFITGHSEGQFRHYILSNGLYHLYQSLKDFRKTVRVDIWKMLRDEV